jgi:hypothetical protein
MVMVPGADECLRQNTQQHPENNKPKALSPEKHYQINAEVGHKQGDRNSIFLKFEHSLYSTSVQPQGIVVGWVQRVKI